MKLPKLLLFVLFFLALPASAELTIDVSLSPAGSYKAKTQKVSGSAYRTADGVGAENVTVDLSTIKTGIALRDKHTKERLEVAKYPEAKLIKAIGKEGKGSALIEIMGKKQKVSGTYEIQGNKLIAHFPVFLPDLDIKDVRYMGVGVKDQIMVHISLQIKDGPPRGTASAKGKPSTRKK